MGISNTSFIGHDPDNFLRYYNDWKCISSRSEFDTVLHPYSGLPKIQRRLFFLGRELDHKNIYSFADIQRPKPFCQNKNDLIKLLVCL